MMPAHREALRGQDINRLGREELIGRLLEYNDRWTFRFTQQWLERQRTERLRELLLAVEQWQNQYQGKNQ